MDEFIEEAAKCALGNGTPGDAIIHVFLNAGGSKASYHKYSLSWNRCGDEKLL